jgi:hypothetical protein
VFSYSLQSVHMGHASYFGHNAMIRMRPFIQHCILPELSGSAPWGGKPLSHDIIESAMMARAGYEVWFLPEIEGSYEEVPSNTRFSDPRASLDARKPSASSLSVSAWVTHELPRSIPKWCVGLHGFAAMGGISKETLIKSLSTRSRNGA